MPIYEYACPTCGHTWEEWQRMDAPMVAPCPDCKAESPRIWPSRTSFVMKGE